MLTCAFIICVLQVLAAGHNLINKRLLTSHVIGHIAALLLGALGAIGLWPLVLGGN